MDRLEALHLLHDALNRTDIDELESIRTQEPDAVTTDGLVLQFKDGSEFLVTLLPVGWPGAERARHGMF